MKNMNMMARVANLEIHIERVELANIAICPCVICHASSFPYTNGVFSLK